MTPALLSAAETRAAVCRYGSAGDRVAYAAEVIAQAVVRAAERQAFPRNS